MKLLEHKAKKEKRVNGFDLISTAFNIAGWSMIAIAAIQPKNPVNMLRIPAAVALFYGSVTAERLRESDLLSLDSATDYEKNVVSDRIRLDTVMHEELHRIQATEAFFQQVPVDLHEAVAQKIGATPPNYAARQPDPVVQQLQQTIEPDPTGDFDPEQQAEKRSNSGSSFIPAEKVSDWFTQMGKAIPESLINEWKAEPGTGISIEDGDANIVRRES